MPSCQPFVRPISEDIMQPSGAAPGSPVDIRQRSSFILSGLTASHALFHAFRQSLLVLLPNVRDAMGLSDVQATSITAIQEFAAGLIDLPGGVGDGPAQAPLGPGHDAVHRGLWHRLAHHRAVTHLSSLIAGDGDRRRSVFAVALASDRGPVAPLCRTARLCPLHPQHRRQYRRYRGAGGDRLAL